MNGKFYLLIFFLLTSTLFTFGYHQQAYGLIQFEQKVDYEVGNTPTSIAVVDLNNDQKVDLAVANGEDNSVSILLGNGDGTFQSAISYNTGEAPEEVVASDFNADEKADLAIANSFDDTLSIFIGKGDGSFEDAVSYDVGEFPLSMVIADFNGDDKDDLAVANGGGLFSSGDISILLGNGDGTFQAASSLVAGSSPTDICSSDLNDDEKMDLAVVDSLDNTISILLGNGNGTFQSAVNYAVGQSPFGVTAGDFNNDQKEDIAVANSGGNNVSILLGKGDGTFQAAINYGAGKWPIAVEAKDFDQNGILDLAVANSGDNNVSILKGTGNGAFQLALNAPAGEFPYDLIASDLNGDGWDDLVVVNNNPVDPSASQVQHVVSVILNSSFLPSQGLDIVTLLAGQDINSETSQTTSSGIHSVGIISIGNKSLTAKLTVTTKDVTGYWWILLIGTSSSNGIGFGYGLTYPSGGLTAVVNLDLWIGFGIVIGGVNTFSSVSAAEPIKYKINVAGTAF